jgi:hypothetical protein
MTVTDLVANFGDVIEMKSQPFDMHHIKQVLANSPHWKQYNPRKPINRYGLSVTSLDGDYSGTPDLDSLREYNLLNGTKFGEFSFKTRTPIVDELGLGGFLDMWGRFLGRSHFLRLDAGGFFPPHRDNGFALPAGTMRIMVPINWRRNHVVWLHEGKPLHLEEGIPHFINTSKEHSLFSFADNTTLLVLNVQATPESILTVAKNAAVI